MVETWQGVKVFKVAAISEGHNAFGLRGHILIASDGEAWEVGRSCSAQPKWRKGDMVPVRTWAGVGVEISRRITDAPKGVIREVWGFMETDEHLLASMDQVDYATVQTALEELTFALLNTDDGINEEQYNRLTDLWRLTFGSQVADPYFKNVHYTDGRWYYPEGG